MRPAAPKPAPKVWGFGRVPREPYLATEPTARIPASPPPPSQKPRTSNPEPSGRGGTDCLRIRGARVHNLKNIDCDIPHNAFTVITGVSGSGKSSLAFDTIYAEGQRRYIESLSAYARQFLERIEKPDVDEISGISPAIAIRQKNSARNPRSTVATATEIYDYLRLLYARAGRTFCRQCGSEVRRDTLDEIAARVMARPAGQRFYVLFPFRISGATAPPAALNPEPSGRGGAGRGGKKTLIPYRRHPAGSLTASPPAAGPEIRPKAPHLRGDGLRRALSDLQKKGFNRLYQSGRVFEFSSPESLLDVDFSQPVFVLVDRLAVSADIRSRLVDSVETCYAEANGEAILEFLPAAAPVGALLAAPHSWTNAGEAGERATFNERFECKKCGLTFPEPEPRLFSFNNPYGACPRCQGFGNTIDFDLDRVIPDKGKSLNEGAIDPWTKPRYRQVLLEMRRFARQHGIPLDVPYRQLSAEQKALIHQGEPLTSRRVSSGFPGIKGFFAWLERKKYKLHIRVFLSRYRGFALCPECAGTRLRAEARGVLLGGGNGQQAKGIPITEVCKMTVAEARQFFTSLRLTATEGEIAGKLLEEIQKRLGFLYDVGLDYISLDRLTSTLSGGEAQRIQLATSLGSHLVGSLYVLDEPSVGLHPRDTRRLIDILKSLRDLGNTVVVVEHDPDTISAADYVLDLGPGAGEHGGRVVFAGPAAGLWKPVPSIRGNGNPAPSAALPPTPGPRTPNIENRRFGPGPDGAGSLTARYLSGELRIPVPGLRRKPSGEFLKVFGARAHNLQEVDALIPLRMLVAITGVSGSGKSTLLHEVIYKCLEGPKLRGTGASVKQLCDRIEGHALIRETILVDQSPIGRTPRSNPATYMKAFDSIREVFAELPDARRRGYSAGHFSFNIPGGRCEACQGDGTVTVEMQFLADVALVCEECRGTRFKSGVLEVRYREKNIHEALQLTVREALSFFSSAPKVINRLRILDEVGLGYLRLGQSATTLSGGEAQRLKLAAHLTRQENNGVLYILDEPTTGLHFDDIQKLLGAFRKLLDGGASLLVIEHNLEVIKSADWVIDLGPEGGDRGGRIVATGTPEQVARVSASYTGKFLSRALQPNGGAPKSRMLGTRGAAVREK